MIVMRYWRIVLAYRAMILSLCLCTLIASLLLASLLPEEYDASALALIRPQETIRFDANKIGKEVLDFPVQQGVPFEVQANTYIEVIRSRAVMEKIVRALGLHEQETSSTDDSSRDLGDYVALAKEYVGRTRDFLKHGRTFEMDPLGEAVEDVERNLSLHATPDTVVFEITYSSTDPQEAAAVANTAAEIFVDTITATTTEEAREATEYLRSQLSEVTQDLDAARLALRMFKAKHSTFALADEYQHDLKVGAEMRFELEQTEAELAGALELHTPSHPRVAALMAERDRLVRSLARLTRSFDTHPEMEARLSSLELGVRVAEDNYELVSKELEEARLRTARTVSGIRVVSRATPPTRPSRPVKIYYAVSGLILALLLGVGLALFLEVENGWIRSVEDASEALGLPVLATIPPLKTAPRND